GLASNPRREVAAPTVVERGHLSEPRGLAVGDAVADAGFQVSGEFFEHPPIIGPATGWDQAYTDDPRRRSARALDRGRSRVPSGAVRGPATGVALASVGRLEDLLEFFGADLQGRRCVLSEIPEVPHPVLVRLATPAHIRVPHPEVMAPTRSDSRAE